MTPNSQRAGGDAVNCQRVEQEEMIERYLAGKLEQAEAEAFEQHYLGCQRCFEELQFRHAAAIELRSRSVAHSQPIVSSSTIRKRWALAAAAILLLTLTSVTILNRRQAFRVDRGALVPPQNSEQIIARLAVIDTAPPYVPITLRGGQSGAATGQFREGMQRYSRGDYAGAITLLEESVRLNADLQPAVFYLGISHLMVGKAEKAISPLSKLTLAGDNPYREESHWFLAKAFLKRGSIAAAQKELEAVVSLNGSHLEDARRDLVLVREIAQETPARSPIQ
jgi:tetratricopeptide (TPR) repeat protein